MDTFLIFDLCQTLTDCEQLGILFEVIRCNRQAYSVSLSVLLEYSQNVFARPPVEGEEYGYNYRWRDRQGRIHRAGDFHALENPNADSDSSGYFSREWYIHGKRHRDGDKPAVIIEDYDGREEPRLEWRIHGQLHREGVDGHPPGPALISRGGDQFWYMRDKLHCDDGPAVIFRDGTQYWYKNGQLHRGKGRPAVIYGEHSHENPGGREWWIHGERIR